jgi:hypothetical protein
MARHKTALLVVVLVLGAVLRAPFLFARHHEGDERDVSALVAALSRGEYSLRNAPEINHGKRRRAYVDAPVYHHPPLYYLVAWSSEQLAGERGLYLVSYLAALAVLALTFLAGTLVRDPATGFTAAVLLLLCPTTQLVAGKIWAESLLAALLTALIYATYRVDHHASTGAAASKRSLASFFALGAAITFTRQTGLFALGFVLPMLVCAAHRRALRAPLLAASAGLCSGLLAWLACSAVLTRSLIPAAARPDPQLNQVTGFVAMLLQRNPVSFLYVPFLLCPLYLFGLALLRPDPGSRPLLPLPLFALSYAAGLTLLAAVAPVSYHMKYMAPALPALALAAAAVLVPLARRRPVLGTALGVAALVYATPMLHKLTVELPAMAEVDPRFFYPALDVLPW